MSIERVRAFFKTYDMDGRILEFPVSSATVELAAQAVGCQPCRIAKTLSFKVGDRTVLKMCIRDSFQSLIINGNRRMFPMPNREKMRLPFPVKNLPDPFDTGHM